MARLTKADRLAKATPEQVAQFERLARMAEAQAAAPSVKLTASAEIVRRTDYICVEVHWSVEDGPRLDRPCTGGISTGQNYSLALRLLRAINAQAVFVSPAIARDVNGATYVQATSRVLGRRLNADLRRLGF